jgi:hypothetical protein
MTMGGTSLLLLGGNMQSFLGPARLTTRLTTGSFPKGAAKSIKKTDMKKRMLYNGMSMAICIIII